MSRILSVTPQYVHGGGLIPSTAVLATSSWFRQDSARDVSHILLSWLSELLTKFIAFFLALHSLPTEPKVLMHCVNREVTVPMHQYLLRLVKPALLSLALPASSRGPVVWPSGVHYPVLGAMSESCVVVGDQCS